MVQTLFKIVTIAAAIFLAGCAGLAEHTVTVSEAQLQQKLQAKLIAPMTVMKIFSLALTNPVIKLDGQTERMSASLDAQISNPFSRAMSGKAAISGKLRFDAISNSVLLTDARLESLNIDGLGGRNAELVSILGQQLGTELLKDFPLYTLKPDDLKLAGITLTPKLMRITPQGLQVTLSPL
jgi:Protein of unknown function (DUF1439)